jgi:hypothetical protein
VCRKICISQNKQNCNLNREAESDDETVDLGAAYFHTNPNSLNLYYIAMSRRDHEKRWHFDGSLGVVLVDALEESLGKSPLLQENLALKHIIRVLWSKHSIWGRYIGVWPSIP